MSCNELKCTCVVKIFTGAVRVAVSPDNDCDTCGTSILTVEFNPVRNVSSCTVLLLLMSALLTNLCSCRCFDMGFSYILLSC